MITLQPITLRAANRFVDDRHRHSEPVRGHRFAIAAYSAERLLVGVAIVGRPVARNLDDGVTAEVTRLCTLEGAPMGTASRLLRASWRAWSAMGGTALITYCLASETGASLRGAGFRILGTVPGRKWNRTSRPRRSRTVEAFDKVRWGLSA